MSSVIELGELIFVIGTVDINIDNLWNIQIWGEFF